jgi:uncharacterized integral membrane protein
MVKRIVGWFVLVPLSAVLIIFALANTQLVIVNFNPFAQADQSATARVGVPLFLVIFLILLVGVVLGGVATWFAQSQHRRDERHWRRETERLHRELDAARRAPASQNLLDVDDLVHHQ